MQDMSRGQTSLDSSGSESRIRNLVATRNLSKNSYFKRPNYEESVAEFVEMSKAPFAITEFLSILSGPMDASNFTGAALVSISPFCQLNFHDSRQP